MLTDNIYWPARPKSKCLAMNAPIDNLLLWQFAASSSSLLYSVLKKISLCLRPGCQMSVTQSRRPSDAVFSSFWFESQILLLLFVFFFKRKTNIFCFVLFCCYFGALLAHCHDVICYSTAGRFASLRASVCVVSASFRFTKELVAMIHDCN